MRILNIKVSKKIFLIQMKNCYQEKVIKLSYFQTTSAINSVGNINGFPDFVVKNGVES